MWLTKSTDFSIKGRLSRSLIIAAVIMWMLIILGSYYTIRHEVEELYDGELAQLARVLLTLYSTNEVDQRARSQGTIVTSPPFEGSDNYEHKLLFQVWGNNKTLLVRSSNAPVTPIARKLKQEELNQFDTVELNNNKIRVFTLWIPQVPFAVTVGQQLELRTEIAGEILESFVPMILLLLPILIFLIHRSINKGMRPLTEISDQITRRTSDNLEPVNIDDVPLEIKGVTVSLNRLFAKLKKSFARERQFIDDAAHELRTPLAGLKAQAQVALVDKSRVETSLNRIVEGVDRTARLANQLLALSRLEAGKIEIEKRQVKLASVIHDVCTDLEISRQKKNISIDKKIDESITINADPDMMYMLIRNLLENAIRYSEPNTQVQVSLENNPQAQLQIQDQGPGIPEENLSRVFDRFYREVNATASGSGLGLAIVKRIAELHDIEIELKNAQFATGLLVKLSFLN